MKSGVCDGHFMLVASANNYRKLLDTFATWVSYERTRVMETGQVKGETVSPFTVVANIYERNESR